MEYEIPLVGTAIPLVGTAFPLVVFAIPVMEIWEIWGFFPLFPNPCIGKIPSSLYKSITPKNPLA